MDSTADVTSPRAEEMGSDMSFSFHAITRPRGQGMITAVAALGTGGEQAIEEPGISPPSPAREAPGPRQVGFGPNDNKGVAVIATPPAGLQIGNPSSQDTLREYSDASELWVQEGTSEAGWRRPRRDHRTPRPSG